VLRHAIGRNADGTAAGPLGKLLGILGQRDRTIKRPRPERRITARLPVRGPGQIPREIGSKIPSRARIIKNICWATDAIRRD
jgi:hypothetical protein